MKIKHTISAIMLAIAPILICAQIKQTNTAKISGKLEYTSPGNQLTLNQFSDLVSPSSILAHELEPSIKLNSQIVNGGFKFILKGLSRNSYIFINNYSEQDEDERMLVYGYFIEPGDDVFVTIKKLPGDTIKGPLAGKNGKKLYIYNTIDLSFSGKGAEKYQLQADLQKQVFAHSSRIGFYTFISKKNTEAKIQDGLNSWDSLKRIGNKLLDQAKPKISDHAYQIIRANFIGNIEQRKLYRYYWHCSNKNVFYKDLFFRNFIDIENVGSESVKLRSPYYIEYLHYYQYVRSLVNSGVDKAPDVSSRYTEAIESFGKPLADRILLYMMLFYKNHFVFPKNYDLVETATKSKDQYVRLVANNIKKIIDENKPGSRPDMDFELTDVNGKKIKLDDFKGKVLFVDFWYTGCGPCTDYYTQVLKDVEAKYHGNKNIAFVTVSIDRIFEAWKASVEMGNYTGDKAINLYTNGLAGAHPLIQKFNISSYPTPMIFDKEGKIFSNERSVLRNKEGLIQKIEEALRK